MMMRATDAARGAALTDVSGETWREYLYPDGATLRVDMPSKLLAMPSGSHRVFDAMGKSRYVRPGWIHVDVGHALGLPVEPVVEPVGGPVAGPVAGRGIGAAP